jgi:hypothetical protein
MYVHTLNCILQAKIFVNSSENTFEAFIQLFVIVREHLKPSSKSEGGQAYDSE